MMEPAMPIHPMLNVSSAASSYRGRYCAMASKFNAGSFLHYKTYQNSRIKADFRTMTVQVKRFQARNALPWQKASSFTY